MCVDDFELLVDCVNKGKIELSKCLGKAVASDAASAFGQSSPHRDAVTVGYRFVA